ncbi:hypothetical protein AAG570_012672 [Ranatra chinensis]|uniref:Uncharacterized protein n=1 Tax=Ranatra chinensis TaxID=642074 RepID=A0ABD0Z0S2_9HEMI
MPTVEWSLRWSGGGMSSPGLSVREEEDVAAWARLVAALFARRTVFRPGLVVSDGPGVTSMGKDYDDIPHIDSDKETDDAQRSMRLSRVCGFHVTLLSVYRPRYQT